MNRRTLLGAAAGAAGSLLMSRSAGAAALSAGMKDGVFWVRDGEQPVLAYRHALVDGPAPANHAHPELFRRAAYLHPVHAPGGGVVSGDWPSDHRHQRGLFFAWTKTLVRTPQGELHPDFWNLGSGTGRIRSLKVEEVPREGSKPGALTFRATHLWEMSPEGGQPSWEPAMDETWEVTVFPPSTHFVGAPADRQASGAAYVFDLVSRQTPRVAIELPEYRYGGMCARAANEWIGKESGLQILTSEGKTGDAAEETRARWADQSGPLAGKSAGITLMEHPSNQGAPNPLRVPPGLPYVVFSPPKAGTLTLAAGKTHTFRYRLVAHNGHADKDALEAEWKRFGQDGG